jgi:hypothetical protein
MARSVAAGERSSLLGILKCHGGGFVRLDSKAMGNVKQHIAKEMAGGDQDAPHYAQNVNPFPERQRRP